MARKLRPRQRTVDSVAKLPKSLDSHYLRLERVDGDIAYVTIENGSDRLAYVPVDVWRMANGNTMVGYVKELFGQKLQNTKKPVGISRNNMTLDDFGKVYDEHDMKSLELDIREKTGDTFVCMFHKYESSHYIGNLKVPADVIQTAFPGSGVNSSLPALSIYKAYRRTCTPTRS